MHLARIPAAHLNKSGRKHIAVRHHSLEKFPQIKIKSNELNDKFSSNLDINCEFYRIYISASLSKSSVGD